MSKYRVGEAVNWFEGRTQRQRFGLIEAVHDIGSGWPPEYTVRPLKRDGNTFKKAQHRYESELRAGLDFDSCCSCHEPLSHLLTCACCYRSVCLGCAHTDGADDSYCPDCWSDMHAFLGEGVSNGNEAPPAHGSHSAGLSAALPYDEQEQLSW